MTASGAVLDARREYRYLAWRTLQRSLTDNGGRALFVMLNPSTADEDLDDMTMIRCRGFARREGARVLEVVNLFAWRATHPDDLLLIPSGRRTTTTSGRRSPARRSSSSSGATSTAGSGSGRPRSSR